MANILFFHGFSSNPNSLFGAADLLEKNGHHVHVPYMTSFSYAAKHIPSQQHWIEEAELVIQKYFINIRDDFCLAGHSLGGAICAQLLTTALNKDWRDHISGCAFLATPAGIDSHFMAYWRKQASQYISWPFRLQVQMFSFLQQTDKIFAKIKVPCLVLQGGKDNHIPAGSGKKLCRRLGEHCHTSILHPEADHFFPEHSVGPGSSLLYELVSFFSSLSQQGGSQEIASDRY